MNSKFIIILLLCLTFINIGDAFAIEYQKYLLSDILLLQDIEIQNITLQKDTLCNYSTQIAKIEEKSQVEKFVKELLSENVIRIDSPQTGLRDSLYIDFKTEHNSYRYVHGEGFFITEADSNKTIVLRYSLSEEYRNTIIEDESLHWLVFDESTAMPSETNLFCKFEIGSNNFFADNTVKLVDENPLVVPYIDNYSSRTMIPLRCISEIFDFKIQWLPKTNKIVLEKNGFVITMEIGLTTVVAKQYSTVHGASYLNDNQTIPRKEYWQKEFNLEIQPTIVHNRTFIPLRFVTDLFGYKVVWDNNENAIYIYPEKAELNLHTYPFVEISDGVINAGLKTFNTAIVPYVMRFVDGSQLILKINALNGELELSTGRGSTQVLTERIICPETEDIITSDFLRNRLTNGIYYLDLCYGNDTNTIYRLLLNVI